MSDYNISIDDLSQKFSGKSFGEVQKLGHKQKTDIVEQIVQSIAEQIQTGKITFPYHRFHSLDPKILFDNIRLANLPVSNKQYEMRSYLPRYQSYLPPKFRGKYVNIFRDNKFYESADILSDYFIEDIRLQARKNDQSKSMIACWNDTQCLKEKLLLPIFTKLKANEIPKFITPKTLRDSLYYVYAETGTFNPTNAIAVLKEVFSGSDLEGKKWIDFSAGWGDRLLASKALKMNYIGYDPNINLKRGHDEMMKLFGESKIYYEPFELAVILDGPFDFCFTSSPFFDIEIYAENQQGQSIENYPTYTKWMVWFMFRSLLKIWDVLKYGGYLILHLGDNNTANMTEQTNIFIENFLPGASWEGVIGLAGSSGYSRPVWVWKKLHPSEIKSWEPELSNKSQQSSFSNRSLMKFYPDLHKEFIHFYCSEYAPNYNIRYKNLSKILDSVDSPLLDDRLKLYCLYELPILNNILNDIFDHRIPLSLFEISSFNSDFDRIKLEIDTFHLKLSDFWETNYKDLHNSFSKNYGDLIDDLMIYSLLESLGEENTILWITSIMLLSLK